jgi:hypothetical protein
VPLRHAPCYYVCYQPDYDVAQRHHWPALYRYIFKCPLRTLSVRLLISFTTGYVSAGFVQATIFSKATQLCMIVLPNASPRPFWGQSSLVSPVATSETPSIYGPTLR